jgi:hypothetical protein
MTSGRKPITVAVVCAVLAVLLLTAGIGFRRNAASGVPTGGNASPESGRGKDSPPATCCPSPVHAERPGK